MSKKKKRKTIPPHRKVELDNINLSKSENMKNVMLQGTLLPNGTATAKFEWGLDTTYGNEFTLDPLTGTVVVPVEHEVDGLEPLTDYHCRLSAINETGVPAVTEDLVFTTLADTQLEPQVVILPPLNL